MAKHSMYDENPRLEHDDEGNVRVKKDAKKESSADNTGEPDGAGLSELIKQHEEMKKMHDKHQADSLERIKKATGSTDESTPVNNK